MRKASISTFFLATAFSCTQANADFIDVATLSLSADTPDTGLQEIAITNQTGTFNGCNATYQVCDALAFNSWTLTINYTSTYYNGVGPALTVPYVAQSSGSGDSILPTAPLAFDFDLCGAFSVSDCGGQTTTITEIDFTATLNESSFTLFDPNADGGMGGPGPTFFANPSFTVQLLPSADFPGGYYESQDGFVSDLIVATPEPGTFLLLLASLTALNGFRRRT